MVCKDFAYPELLRYFEEISEIPRPSYHEEAIADYLVEFAKSRGLEYYRDSYNNVLINMTATENRENTAPLLLQGHTDMVCEKNSDVTHDFSKDPLKLYEKDGWLRAEGTTLGADNGDAVAAMLAILDGACESHGAIQCLFTASEEVGLDGATGFDYSRIYATKMLNMDSADESLIIAGCAGGLRSTVTLPVARERAEGDILEIHIGGLAGGHSGEDIHRGRANANKLMGRVLSRVFAELSCARLVSIDGGTKENAIPREASALILTKDKERAALICRELSAVIASELCADDGGFYLTVGDAECDLLSMTRDSSERILFLVFAMPNGVFEMNNELPEIVEYSRNLGIVKTDKDSVCVTINSRSSRESRLDLSVEEIDAFARNLGGVSAHYSRYPGWEYAADSAIRADYTKAYRELYGAEPRVEVIHAGLECGIIKKYLPSMDMISCGPVVINLHSPDEAMNLASFERFFTVVCKVITDMN